MSARFPDEMTQEELSAYRRAAKEGLRKRLAALRRSLNAEARAERAAAACAHLAADACFAEARLVLAYAPLRFELDPGRLLAVARTHGKRVALPRVVPETGDLSLHVYADGDSLEESGFGVREPLPSAERVAPHQVDLVLVPGLAFDASGYRLGYGKGFYDRLLPHLSLARSVGMAFELSLLPEVPREEHDIPVQRVVTEKRVLIAQAGLR
ncbi:MAG TPA: 5-formyltetrahydrofolate cyclo-ligase [Polyangiales bacterium]